MIRLKQDTIGNGRDIPQGGDLVSSGIFKIWFVFDDTVERDAFFVAHPEYLIEDILIAIKDTSPPPTPGTRSLDYSKKLNSQYVPLTF